MTQSFRARPSGGAAFQKAAEQSLYVAEAKKQRRKGRKKRRKRSGRGFVYSSDPSLQAVRARVPGTVMPAAAVGPPIPTAIPPIGPRGVTLDPAQLVSREIKLREALSPENIPLIGGGLRARAGAAGLRMIPGIGRYLGRPDFGPRLGRVGAAAATAAGGALVGEAIDWLQGIPRAPGEGRMLPEGPVGGGQVMQQSPLGTLSRGQEFPGGPFVVKTWDTYPGPGVTGGGAWPIFALLSDGRIVVSKPNGSWKVYRPKKNLVISSNPRLRDVRKLDRMHKRVVKMMRGMVPRPKARK